MINWSQNIFLALSANAWLSGSYRTPCEIILSQVTVMPISASIYRRQIVMLSGLSMKLRQFGDKVHLADELIPTFVAVLVTLTIYCERILSS